MANTLQLRRGIKTNCPTLASGEPAWCTDTFELVVGTGSANKYFGANPMTAAGDIIYGGTSGAMTRLAKGTAYQGLHMNSGATAPEWQATLQSLLTAAGDIVYASGANTPARLAKGTDGQVLTLASGVPSWAAAAGGVSDGDKGDITVSSSGAAWAIDSGVISQSKLKTSTGAVSSNTSSPVNLTLPGGEYGFYPQVKHHDTYNNTFQVGSAYLAVGIASASYVTNINLTAYGSGYTMYAQQRYVTSSGEVFWIFILRDKETKKVVAMWAAPDHPCFGNGGKPLLVPHPFVNYEPETQEIVVVNPTIEQLSIMEAKRFVDADNIPDLSLLEVIQRFYDIDETSSPAWPTEKVTVGLPEGHDWKCMIGKLVTPIKKTIPQPDNVLVRSLKSKV